MRAVTHDARGRVPVCGRQNTHCKIGAKEPFVLYHHHHHARTHACNPRFSELCDSASGELAARCVPENMCTRVCDTLPYSHSHIHPILICPNPLQFSSWMTFARSSTDWKRRPTHRSEWRANRTDRYWPRRSRNRGANRVCA